MREIAQRAKIPRSATVSIENRATEMKRKGMKIISLAAGQPDFVTPQHIREYAKKALDDGYTFYPPSNGVPELREAISKKVAEENGINVNPESEIIVTVGGKQGVFSAILTLVDSGDEVIVADPSWVTYEPCVRLAAGKIIPVPVHEKNEFRLSAEDVMKAVTRKTKLIIINSPNNPTGSILRKEDLEKIAKVACEKDLFVLSDEIYEYLVYDGLKHCSIASLPGMRERTITANGFSKAYSMTGWRLGYLVGPREIVQHILAIHEHSVTGPSSFSQRAVAQANGRSTIKGVHQKHGHRIREEKKGDCRRIEQDRKHFMHQTKRSILRLCQHQQAGKKLDGDHKPAPRQSIGCHGSRLSLRSERRRISQIELRELNRKHSGSLESNWNYIERSLDQMAFAFWSSIRYFQLSMRHWVIHYSGYLLN